MDFSNVTVLCVGDLMLDRFVHGDMEMISEEAPVPVIRQTRVCEMLGGAGNMANNITSLGGKDIMVGAAGNDDAGAALGRLMAENKTMLDAVVTTCHRPTNRKSRFLASQQQVTRIDEESRIDLHPDDEAKIIDTITAHMLAADVVVISDYVEGVCTDAVVAQCISAAQRRGIGVFVDSRSRDFSRFSGATCIKPNVCELANASRMAVDSKEAITAAARHVMEQASARAILVTRSEKGMMLVTAEGRVVPIPSHARRVVELSGVGDTAIATLALAYATGNDLESAMHIASVAAGIVIGKPSTATVSIKELQDELTAHGPTHACPTSPELISLDAAKKLVDSWKAEGLKVGFTNGCFDILHPGHISCLAGARAACDKLLVAINGDASIRRLKGPSRPVNSLEARAAVTVFDGDTPLELIRMLKPDVLVKGAEYTVEQVVGSEDVIATGGRVVLVQVNPGHSTTNIITQIRRQSI